jgi:ubiquinone/menaquinone biosynthesis C-methylase UbiE
MNRSQQDVTTYYEQKWPTFAKWMHAEQTQGIHMGYYERGIKTYNEAILNMNRFAGTLLNLKTSAKKHILDAGCGVGGTTLYLAQTYPNTHVEGIDVTPSQIKRAKTNAQHANVHNVTFSQGDSTQTQYPDASFDGILALESINYTTQLQKFTKEMYRLLKPKGRLVLIDGFRMKPLKSDITKIIYDSWRRAQNNVNIHELSSIMKQLSIDGFLVLQEKDLSKNVGKFMIQPVLLGIPFFIHFLLKRIAYGRDYNSEKDVSFYLGSTLLTCYLGVQNVMGYYALVAEKK